VSNKTSNTTIATAPDRAFSVSVTSYHNYPKHSLVKQCKPRVFPASSKQSTGYFLITLFG